MTKYESGDKVIVEGKFIATVSYLIFDEDTVVVELDSGFRVPYYDEDVEPLTKLAKKLNGIE